MSIATRAAVAASIIIAASAGQAQSRDLDSGYHGNTPVITTYLGGPKSAASKDGAMSTGNILHDGAEWSRGQGAASHIAL